MNTHDKKTQKVDTQFVLAELNKIRQAIDELYARSDYLYACVLLEEIKDFIKSYKTFTLFKIQNKFGLGYARSCFIIELLEKEGYISLDKSNKRTKTYIVNKK